MLTLIYVVPGLDGKTLSCYRSHLSHALCDLPPIKHCFTSYSYIVIRENFLSRNKNNQFMD